MSNQMKQEVVKTIEKAGEALESAKYNLAGEFYFATINRSYYSCFYCMVGLLYTVNVYAKTHQGVQQKFSELFVKTGLFPEEASTIVSDLASSRQEADYDFDADVTETDAAAIVEKAERFLSLTKRYFESKID